MEKLLLSLGLTVGPRETVIATVAGLVLLFVVFRLALGPRKPKTVVGPATSTASAAPAPAASSAAPGFLHPQDWKPVKLVAKTKVNHNTNLYRFALPSVDDELYLPVGKHVKLGFLQDGKYVQRAYTPVSIADQRGHFDLVIKIYPQGAMSQHVEGMHIGDEIAVRGPHGLMKYQPNMKKNIGMIAGGSGVTPMLQLARAVLGNPGDRTQLSLIFANIAEEDILLREELERHARNPQFSLFFVLQTPPPEWQGGVGFVSQEHIRQHMPPPGPDTLICLCGPPPMLDAMQKHLAALGYTKEMIFQY